MKSCALCKSLARIYCDSDQASLCWDCDKKVHSANFLVARHSRSLLCHVCLSPTPWTASGEKLGPTVSVCERCVEGSDEKDVDQDESEGGNDDEIDTDDDEEELDLDDEGGDNQVVPWSSTSHPPPASSSSSEESSSWFSNGDRVVSLKRMRENVADLCSEDDLDCTSSQRNNRTQSTAAAAAAAKSTEGGEAAFIDSIPSRPLKSRRTEANQSTRDQHGPAGLRSVAIVDTLERFHQQEMASGNNVSVVFAGICKNPRAVDYDSSKSS